MLFWIGFGCGVVCVLFAAVSMLLVLYVVQLIGQSHERRKRNVRNRSNYSGDERRS